MERASRLSPPPSRAAAGAVAARGPPRELLLKPFVRLVEHPHIEQRVEQLTAEHERLRRQEGA